MQWLGNTEEEKREYKKSLMAYAKSKGASVPDILENFNAVWLAEHGTETPNTVKSEKNQFQKAKSTPKASKRGKQSVKAEKVTSKPKTSVKASHTEQNTAEQLETVTDAGEITIQEYKNRIYNALDDALCEMAIKQDSDGKYKINTLQWMGVCKRVGDTVFKDKRALKEQISESRSAMPTNNNAYNLDILLSLADIFERLCMSYNVPCKVYDFASFVNIDYQTIVNSQHRASPKGLELFKKLYTAQEQTIASAGESGRINMTLALARLNSKHGWTRTTETIHTDGGAVVGGQSWRDRFAITQDIVVGSDLIEDKQPVNVPELPQIQ